MRLGLQSIDASPYSEARLLGTSNCCVKETQTGKHQGKAVGLDVKTGADIYLECFVFVVADAQSYLLMEPTGIILGTEGMIEGDDVQGTTMGGADQ